MTENKVIIGVIKYFSNRFKVINKHFSIPEI